MLLLCGALFCGAVGADGDTHTHDGIDFQPWTKTDSLPGWGDLTDGTGSFYLDTDVTLNSTWEVTSGTVNLCLNGHVIRMKDGVEGSVICVTPGNLNLYDCNSTGMTHKFSVDSNTGLWKLDEAKGKQTLTGGCITGGNSDEGGGVAVGSTFTMFGGNIVGNTADYGGGVGIFTMIHHGTTMNGGNIIGNTANVSGGGVNVRNQGKFNMNGGDIAKNRVKTNGMDSSNGGGVCIGYDRSSCTFTMSGGRIIGNDTVPNTGAVVGLGGGVYVNSISTFNVLGTPVIKDNKAGTSANNVYLDGGVPITVTNHLSGAEIRIVYPTSDTFGRISKDNGWGEADVKQAAACFFLDPPVDNRLIKATYCPPSDSSHYNKDLQWTTKTANVYNITYHLVDGTADPASSVSAVYDTPFEVRAPTKKGCTFSGWRIDTDNYANAVYGESPSSQPTHITNSSTVCKAASGQTGSLWFRNLSPTAGHYVPLIAVWEIGYTITVPQLDHGHIEYEEVTANTSSGKTIHITAIPESGYQLIANSLIVYRTGEPTETVAIDADNTFQMPAFDVTITAEFEVRKDATKVTYCNSDGTEESRWYYMGETFSLPDIPTKTGDLFLGWVAVSDTGKTPFIFCDGTKYVYIPDSPYYDKEHKWIFEAAPALKVYPLWASSAGPSDLSTKDMTVRCEEDGGSYTLSIPPTLSLSRDKIISTTIGVDDVTVTEGKHVDVTLTTTYVKDGSTFLLKRSGAEDIEYCIAYTESAFNPGSTEHLIENNEKVIQGVTAVKEKEDKELFFKMTANPKTAGTFEGTLTFTASVNPDEP